jgi:hypothetical protein
MLAVRLNERLEEELTYYTKIYAQTKTEVVKEALKLYFEIQREKNKKRPFELGKELFGRYESGESNLSTSYKKRLKEKLSEKYSLNR